MRIAHGVPAPDSSGRKGLRRFRAALQPHMRPLWLGIGLLPLVVGAKLLMPYLIKVALDGDPGTMLRTAVVLAILVVAGYAVESVHAWLLQAVGHRALSSMRSRIFAHLMDQGTAFFDTRPVGSLLSRITSDTESVGQSFTLGMVSMAADAMLIVGTLAAMVSLDARLTSYVLLLAPPIFLIVRLFNRLLRGFADHIRRAVASINSTIEENLAGIGIVHLFRREAQSQHELEEQTQRYFGLYTRFNVADAGLYAIMESLSAFTVGALLYFATAPVLEGGMTIGLVVAFVQYVQQGFVPIKEFSGKLAGLQSAFASLDRMDRSLSFDTHMEMGAVPWSERRGAIDIEGVRFRYRDEGPDVLEDIDLHIRPGERLAIVGPTGSGKTTLLNLLTRHYRPSEGRITLDDRPLHDVAEGDFRAGVGIIRQDVFLFEGTVAENVTLGEPGITRADAERAIAAVHLDRLLGSRHGGLDARVDEGGRNLSAGEAQLLTLARVMARNPSVVLLDEATARVDSVTEELIGDAIAEMMAGRTVVAVAHRLSTVRAADRILVMRSGRIVESGSHAELIAADGLYARMWRHRVRTEG